MNHIKVLEPWADPRGGQIDRVIVDNGTIAIEVLSLGGIIRNLWVPDRDGTRQNIVLGCDSIEAYLEQNAHLGAIAGRFANRIAKGKLEHEGQQYQLDINNQANCLHGGRDGFNQKQWKIGHLVDGVRLTLCSPDGEMGFPGKCSVQLDYRLVGNNLFVEIYATTTKPCPINLTQHSYFNLDGSTHIGSHSFQTDCTSYLKADHEGIPISIESTADTELDFAYQQTLSAGLQSESLSATKGFDHCFVMAENDEELQRFGCVSSAVSGIEMTVHTNQPGVQFYTANFLQGTVGKNQKVYQQHQAICIEPQLFPNAPNSPKLSSEGWTLPDQTYHHLSRYQFETIK
ncbi:galactose mutarotase [Parashewanella spongiae]|uniref:Aldose 1-epimerase n=1 Tax=Parashewanella spongiae TaxID=342950 RepID=A0A3A6U2D1_9GAMM|nr:aldose epimerase family protein [Parashewanella spongiae]MCL1079721.1 galactose mutarotase [Parashewanella spongiae]RJY07000.1 galactose mutarotase [Parashewanella spongiae]